VTIDSRCALQANTSVRALGRRTVIISRAMGHLAAHPIRVSVAGILGHTIVTSVERHVRNAIVPLDASSLLETGGNVWADFAEDGNLPLQDLLVRADLHLAGDVVDEALPGTIIEDLLPQRSWGMEILGSNLGQESDGVASEVTVSLVKIDGSLSKLDRIDRAQVVGASTLVVEGHAAVALEVAIFESSSRGIDWKLLVVDAYAVAVAVWVGEKMRLQDRIG
jgi:hypothetical protein